MKYITIATVLFVAAASAHLPVPFGGFNATHNNVTVPAGGFNATHNNVAVPVGGFNATHINVTVHGGPSPGWMNGTSMPPSNKQVEVEKAQVYSAGDYYAAPTPTAESTMAFPTDTSKVSVTPVSLPPVITNFAGKEVRNGASSVASIGGLVPVLAALVSFGWLL